MKYILLQSGLVPLKMVENGAATSVNKEVCICIMYVCIYACIYIRTFGCLLMHGIYCVREDYFNVCMYVCMYVCSWL